MDKQTIIKGLRDLIGDRENFIDEEDPKCIFKYDRKVLEEAIRIIEEAPEVPVREQSKEIIINSKNTKTPAEIQSDVKKSLFQLEKKL